MVMKTITIENLIPSVLKVYKNGMLIDTISTDQITTLDYDIINGIYLFDNEGNQDVHFYLDNETKCKLYTRITPTNNAYYYYTALELVQYCDNKYKEGVDLYNQLIKIIEDDCLQLHNKCS
jgi:hypothetical protein